MEGYGELEDGVDESKLRELLSEDSSVATVFEIIPGEGETVFFKVDVIFGNIQEKGVGVDAKWTAQARMESILEEAFLEFNVEAQLYTPQPA